MRGSVAGSIGSKDAVTCGNAHCSVRQTTLGSPVLARVAANTQATVKSKGRLVLTIATIRATGLDTASLDCPEIKPAPSASAVKSLRNRYGDPSCLVTAL